METNLFNFSVDCVCGIDYGLRCPAIVVIPPTATEEVFVPFSACEFYYLTNTPSHALNCKNLHGTLLTDWDSAPNRFESIAQWALKCITDNKVRTVGLEGYAFGAKGNSLIDLAENCGMLKWFMHTHSIPYDIHAPTKIKKFATTSGRADKDAMYSYFMEYTGIDLNGAFGREPDAKSKSPVSDLVDAYFIACLQRVESAITNADYGVSELLPNPKKEEKRNELL